MKSCNVCKKTKELSEFPKAKTPDGLAYSCRGCCTLRSKKHRQRNREQYTLWRGEWRKKHGRKAYVAMMGSPIGRMRRLVANAKFRAKRAQLSCNIDSEWLILKFKNQDGKCHLTGIQFDLAQTRDSWMNPYSPSIDRIDSSQGYTKDNVRLVCTCVNLGLSNFGIGVFTEMCKKFLQYQQIAI